MSRSFVGALCALLLSVLLISCGGSGEAGLSAASREVQNIQRYAWLSMANNGMPLPFFFFGGGTSGTTGGSGGGGGGMIGYPSMGGFMRHLGGPEGFRATMQMHTRGGTSGSTGGTGGGGGQPSFYYDEWLQLWVDVSFTENSFTALFYMDEAKTQPAGHVTSTFTGDWYTYPQTYQSSYEYTAGTMAGAHGTYSSTHTSEQVGQMAYDNVYADGATDHGESAWNETQSSWTSEWHSVGNARWYADSGVWHADGSADYQCATSDGWASTWHYNSDWSGNAHFEGPDALLPADMIWTATGHYRIVYANGRVEEWNWDDFWGGTGTSGSTSAGTTTTTGGNGGTAVTTSAGGTSGSTSGSTSGGTGATTTGGSTGSTGSG